MNNCRKCNLPIPATIIIDNKRRNLSNRKFCLTCSPFGTKNTKPDDPSKLSARKQIDGRRVSYGDWNPKTKEEFKARLYWKANNRKNKLVKLKGGRCSICGYDKCTRALSFHHREPSLKSFALDKKAIQSKNWNLILLEAEKCDLLCIRCHMEVEEDISSKKYQIYKDKFCSNH